VNLYRRFLLHLLTLFRFAIHPSPEFIPRENVPFQVSMELLSGILQHVFASSTIAPSDCSMFSFGHSHEEMASAFFQSWACACQLLFRSMKQIDSMRDLAPLEYRGAKLGW